MPARRGGNGGRRWRTRRAIGRSFWRSIPARLFCCRRALLRSGSAYRASRRVPLDPPVSSTIVARTSRDPVITRFLERLKAAFDDELSFGGVPLRLLTGRRIRYFNLAYDLGRVSAAARAASVAQPALSQQLHKLEESLGTPLFDRRTFGLVRTEVSERFRACGGSARQALTRTGDQWRDSVAGRGGAGLVSACLPSVSHHGHLVNRITEAVLQLRETLSSHEHHRPRGAERYAPETGCSADGSALRSSRRRFVADAAARSRCQRGNWSLLPIHAMGYCRRVLSGFPISPKCRSRSRQPCSVCDSFWTRAARGEGPGVEIRPRHEIDALTMLIALLAA